MIENKHKTKVWVLSIGLSFIFLFLGFQLADRLGLFLALLFSLAFFILMFFYGNGNLLKALNAKRWQGQDPWGIQEQISKYSDLLKMPEPNFYLINTAQPVAFCLGGNLRTGVVCLSLGLIKKFTPEELETVIAHQVCHIHRLDNFSYVSMQVLSNMLMGLARFLDHFWPARLFKIRVINRPFQNLISPLAWLILRTVVNDKLFFENDDMTLTLIKNRSALAQALWKLEGFNTTHPLKTPPCTQHCFMVNPGVFSSRNWYFLAHPNIEIRIKRLLGYFPI